MALPPRNHLGRYSRSHHHILISTLPGGEEPLAVGHLLSYGLCRLAWLEVAQPPAADTPGRSGFLALLGRLQFDFCHLHVCHRATLDEDIDL